MLELSYNDLTGTVPAGWQSNRLRRLGLGSNQLFTDTALSINLPHVGLLDLSNMTFQATPVHTDFARLQSPGFLNTSGSSLPCPYPSVLTLTGTLLWVRAPCTMSLTLLWILVASAGLVLLGSVVWTLYKQSKPAVAHQQRPSTWRTLSKSVIWLLVVADIVTDSLFDASMLHYVESVPLSSVECDSMNYVFMPALYPGLLHEDEDWIYLYDTYSHYYNGFLDEDFAGYVILLRNFLSARVRYNGEDPSYAAEVERSVIDAFSTQCALMPGCEYIPDAYLCSKNASYQAFGTFSLCVYVVAGLMAFKETCKGLLLVWCLWKGRVPIEFRDVCASSVVLPLLALRPALLSHVFLHETSGMDALWALVYDGFFEIIPQLFLAVYYAMSVVGTGLSGWQMVSIFLSGMACLRLCGEAWAGFGLRDFLPTGVLWQHLLPCLCACLSLLCCLSNEHLCLACRT